MTAATSDPKAEVARLTADLAAARAERDGLTKALRRVVDLFRMYRDDPPSGWDALADDMHDAALAALPPKEAVVEDDTVPPDAVVMRYGDKSTVIRDLAPPKEVDDA